MKNKIRLYVTIVFLVVVFACQLTPPRSVTTSPETPAQTPSPTPQPTKTLAPTLTFTSTPISTNVSLETNKDGTSLFTDELGGYSLIIPEKWVAFTFDLQGIETVDQKLGSKNRQLIEIVGEINSLADDGYRLFAFDTKVGHAKSGYLPNLTVQIYTDPESRSYDPNDIADYWMKDIKEEIPGTEVAVSHSRIKTGGMYASLVFDNTISFENNDHLRVTEMIIIFQAYKALTIIHLYSPEETAYEVELVINNLFQTIRGMRP